MEAKEKENMIALLNEQLEKDLAAADSTFEKKMIYFLDYGGITQFKYQ